MMPGKGKMIVTGSIFIADLWRHQEPMALLHSDDKIFQGPLQRAKMTVLLQLVQHVGVVFKADQQISHQHPVERLRNGAQQVGGDLGLDYQRSPR